MKFKSLFRTKSIQSLLNEEGSGNRHLLRTLKLKDLTFIGIAAIVGAGIFGTIGTAASNGGPAVSLLFIFTSIACLFSALCYAQFASSIPIAGSAYTYAYTSFGELVAWIIGWDLIMEYAIGNVTVAISWSDYFTTLLQHSFHIHVPEYLSMDYLSASRLYIQYNELLSSNQPIDPYVKSAYEAWVNAPSVGSFKLIIDLPAHVINILITWLVFIGIKESKRANNALVVIKLLILLLIIVAGFGAVNSELWNPFAPNGLSGVMKGVSGVFFAYIGFDAISTTAEEAVNPKKDLPKAMILSLVICTVLYVIITFILTGLVPYTSLSVGDPLAFAFQKAGLNFLSGIVAAGAVVAMTSVLLVFQLGQPRIWMCMGRDGLLPKVFAKVHPKYQTPGFSTIVTGIAVGVPILFLNLQEVTDLTSIGTLFAFVLVCGGILVKEPAVSENGFKVPYINGKYLIPLMYIGTWIILFVLFKTELKEFFTYGSWDSFQHKIPQLIFIVIATLLSITTFIKNLSSIPVLGLITNLYLMSELGVLNWLRFLIWLLIGLVIYFLYSKKNSLLNK